MTIDPVTVREFLTEWRKGLETSGANHSHEILDDLEETLFGPTLPTLADMTPEEREACQWMQAQVFPTSSTLGIITGVDGYARSAIILFADGMAKNVPWEEITPRPDLPKLEWPGSHIAEQRAHAKLRAEMGELVEYLSIQEGNDRPSRHYVHGQHSAMELIKDILEADNG